MGQAAHKAYGVHCDHVQTAGQGQLAGGGVQGGEQHVRLHHLSPAQGVQKAGLAHVGVAHQADHRGTGLLAGTAVLAAALFQFGELLLQRFDAPVDVPPVVFQLAFACAAPCTAAAATAAALAGQALAQTLQPGQPVAQHGQLGLHLTLIGYRPAAEDLQNQHGAVQHLHIQPLGQVADLAAGQLAVKDGRLGP